MNGASALKGMQVEKDTARKPSVDPNTKFTNMDAIKKAIDEDAEREGKTVNPYLGAGEKIEGCGIRMS